MPRFLIHGFGRARPRRAWFCALLFAAIAPAAAHAGMHMPAAAEWLKKINEAAARMSFSGVFVHASDGMVDTLQVTRRIRAGNVRERLYSLSGARREIVRDDDFVRCYFAGQSFGMRGYREAVKNGFPRILSGDFRGLKRNYHFSVGGSTRIADRAARQVNVLPNDAYRYGYRLWADLETGLLLRSDLIGEDGGVVDQYMFVLIDIGADISDSALRASGGEAVTLHDAAAQSGEEGSAQSKWTFAQLPAGYQLHRHVHRASPGARDIEHLVFSDGLSSISVFIKPAAALRRHAGLSRVGAVHIHRSRVHGHLVTVMGETPARAVELLAAGISYNG